MLGPSLKLLKCVAATRFKFDTTLILLVQPHFALLQVKTRVKISAIWTRWSPCVDYLRLI